MAKNATKTITQRFVSTVRDTVRRISAKASEMSLSAYAQAFLRGENPTTPSLGGPSKPFHQSLWFYSCITAIVTPASSVPFRLSQGAAAATKAFMGSALVRMGRPETRKVRREKYAELKAAVGEIVESGDLYTLTQRPNDHQTWSQFIEQTIGLLYVCGRVHWLFDDMIVRRPVSIEVVPGTVTQPITQKNGRFKRLIGWTMTYPDDGQQYSLTLGECVTFQIFNPDEPHKGLSPRHPAELAIVSDYNASLYNASMFGNSAEPGGLLSTDAPFDADKDQQIKTSWNQRHAGAAKAKRPAVLWGGMKWQSIASTMADLQFIEGKRLTREEICTACRVPPAVAGFTGTTGDASAYYHAEQERFWQDTETPLLARIAEGFNIHVASRFPGNLAGWFDVEQVPIVQWLRRASVDTALKLCDHAVPMADVNELYDLGLPDRPWYQTGFLSNGLLPVNDIISGNVGLPVNEGTTLPGNDLLNQEVPADQPKSQDYSAEVGASATKAGKAETPLSPVAKAAAERLWIAWQRSWSGLAKSLRGMLRSHFLAQQRRLLAALEKEQQNNSQSSSAGKPASEDRSATRDPRSVKVDSSIVARLLMEISPIGEDGKRFSARLRAFVTDAKKLGLREALREAGYSGDTLEEALKRLTSDPRITAAIQQETVLVSSLIDARTRTILRHSLAEGVDAGEDLRQLADRVQEVMGNRRAAAYDIARNTVTGSLTSARFQASLGVGMTHKLWLYSRGPGIRRPAHVDQEAVTQNNPVPIDQPFVINGVQLMYPRDWSAGAPGETVNCQCTFICTRVAAGEKPTTEGMILAAEKIFCPDCPDTEAQRKTHDST